MTVYYVDPAVGSSGAGTSWGTAYKTLKEATDTAGGSDEIRMSNATADVIGANTTYTLTDGVTIRSCSGATDAYATEASVSSTTFGVDIVFRGKGSIFGLNVTAANTGTATLTLCDVDDSSLYAEDCVFSVPSTSPSSFVLGTEGASANINLITRHCKFRFGATGASISVGCRWRSCGDSFADTGTAPNTLIGYVRENQSDIIIEGGDLSNISGTILVGNTLIPAVVRLVSCKLHASATLLGTTISGGSSEIFATDCSFDNAGTLTGLLFYHQNHYGSTTVTTSVYQNDADTFNGTNKCAWIVDGTANATFGRHYISPWIAAYNTDVSTAVTPRLEVVREGSTTAYTDAEVWAEFAYRGTANSPAMTYVNDRAVPIVAAANQGSSALGAGDWTGENATAWFGKLEALSSFTPAEVGYLMARVCVAGNNTVVVNPKILGLA